MGVDTKAIIKKGTTIIELTEFMKDNFIDVKIHPTQDNYFFIINFDYKEDRRSMNVFLNNFGETDYGIDGVLLSLGCNTDAIEIMKIILNKFGGYLDENDCDDKDFYPVNIGEFKKSREYTELDKLKTEIIKDLGYTNLKPALLLFEKYKKIY